MIVLEFQAQVELELGQRTLGMRIELNLERPDDDALVTIESASLRYRIALGPIAGRKTLRLQAPGAIGTPVESATPLTANRDGFSLNASVACRPEERKCRAPRYLGRASHSEWDSETNGGRLLAMGSDTIEPMKMGNVVPDVVSELGPCSMTTPLATFLGSLPH